jgi:hypothetical protein
MQSHRIQLITEKLNELRDGPEEGLEFTESLLRHLQEGQRTRKSSSRCNKRHPRQTECMAIAQAPTCPAGCAVMGELWVTAVRASRTSNVLPFNSRYVM